tara:strand:+ start:53 stop:532 length:480 start_codon:yes stop_codon:yes gene_type:complete
MNKYEKSKIYKLVNEQGMCYYGSTIHCIDKRKSKHYCEFKSGNSNYTSKFLFENNKKVHVELVELFPCNSKEELHARERYHIENNPCVNKVIPGRTGKEYYQDNLIYKIMWQADYDANHKEQIKLKGQNYYKNNKEIINLKRRIRYEEKKKLKNQEKVI